MFPFDIGHLIEIKDRWTCVGHTFLFLFFFIGLNQPRNKVLFIIAFKMPVLEFARPCFIIGLAVLREYIMLVIRLSSLSLSRRVRQAMRRCEVDDVDDEDDGGRRGAAFSRGFLK